MVFGIGSLSGGFVKLNALFPPIIAVAAASLRWFVASPASEMVLAALPVPVEKVPFLVAASLPALIFISGLLPIMGLAAAKPDGYDNRHPRLMKTAESLMPKYPLNFRLQSAHNNTIEMVAMAAPAFFVAHALGLNQLLLAKLSVLLLLVRLVYIPDDRHRATGRRALTPRGGARSQGKGLKVNTGLRGLAPRSGFPLAADRPLYSEL